MPLIQIKVLAGVFTAPEKRDMVERVTEAVVEIAGEPFRQVTWCLVEEVASGHWSMAGQALTTDDVKALARG